jgi:hypothetical protein
LITINKNYNLSERGLVVHIKLAESFVFHFESALSDSFFLQFINPNEPLLSQKLIFSPTMMVLDFCWLMIYALAAGMIPL